MTAWIHVVYKTQFCRCWPNSLVKAGALWTHGTIMYTAVSDNGLYLHVGMCRTRIIRTLLMDVQ